MWYVFGKFVVDDNQEFEYCDKCDVYLLSWCELGCSSGIVSDEMLGVCYRGENEVVCYRGENGVVDYGGENEVVCYGGENKVFFCEVFQVVC